MENPVPVKLWGKEPLYWIHVKLIATDVIQLKSYPGFKGVYAISNHPITRVMVTGYVVKVDERQKFIDYGVSDGTACLPCILWKPTQQEKGNEQMVEANLGDLVTVWGKIKDFREERQINLTKLYIVKNPNAEPLHWLEVMKLREMYKKPFEFIREDTKNETDPWDKNEAEIKDFEHKLKTEIVEYLETRNMQSFSVDTFSSAGEIVTRVREIVLRYRERFKKYDSIKAELPISSKEIEQVLKATFRWLEKEGIVNPKPITQLNREYEFISVKRDLTRRVHCAISENQGESSSGIPLSRIMKNLQSLEKYKKVRRDRVALAIEHLMASGNIYETRDEHYRIV